MACDQWAVGCGHSLEVHFQQFLFPLQIDHLHVLIGHFTLFTIEQPLALPNVPAHWRLEEATSQASHRMMLSCLSRCSARWLDSETVHSHILHWSGRSHLCFLLCRDMLSGCTNLWLQMDHLSPLCILRCHFNFICQHTSHFSLLSSICHYPMCHQT